MATEEETLPKCPFCEKTFASRQGLWVHLKKCEAKPDEEDVDEEPSTKSEEGFLSLFDDDDDESGEEEDEFECPECGYTSNRQFSRCKECGCEVEW